MEGSPLSLYPPLRLWGFLQGKLLLVYVLVTARRAAAESLPQLTGTFSLPDSPRQHILPLNKALLWKVLPFDLAKSACVWKRPGIITGILQMHPNMAR